MEDNKVLDSKDVLVEEDEISKLLGGLSDSDKAKLKEMLNNVEPKEDMSVGNKTEKVLPDVIVSANNPQISSSEMINLNKAAKYVEKRSDTSQIGVLNSDADTTIEQSLLPPRQMNESQIIPQSFVKNPLTENRGGQQHEGDTLNQTIQVADTFFDPNSVGSAEGVYKREGGRVKHASANPLLIASGQKEGGQLGKGFDPSSDIDRKNNPFKYLVTGFSVKLDGKSINVRQGFDSIDQAKASFDDGIFMIFFEGKVRISKVISGTPIIKDDSGKDIFVYNNSMWVSGN